MSTKEKKTSKNDLEITENERQFGELVKISLILGIVVISGFILYYVLFPEPGYVSFGILNEDKKAEDYPTKAQANVSIPFYVSVGNYLNRKFTFQLKILQGDNETKLTSKGSENAHFDQKTKKKTLENAEEWISDDFSISFSQIGEDQTIIVELWEIKEKDDPKFYDILWLRLNITA